LKKLVAVLALPIALSLLAGCSFKYHGIPGAPLRFASVDYTVLGETTAEACGVYIFGIDFGHLFVDKQMGNGSGSLSFNPMDILVGALSGASSSGNAETGRALYDALEKMPEATNLYAARSHTTVEGFVPYGTPIFGKRCSRVVAHGVKLGKGPVPNAQ
jgi:hypothetical protein